MNRSDLNLPYIVNAYGNLLNVFEEFRAVLEKALEGNQLGFSVEEMREYEFTVNAFDFGKIIIQFTLIIDDEGSPHGRLTAGKFKPTDECRNFWTLYFGAGKILRSGLKNNRKLLFEMDKEESAMLFAADLLQGYLRLPCYREP